VPSLQNLSSADARAVEQTLISYHGLGKDGGTLINKVNLISSVRNQTKYEQGLIRGFDLLKKQDMNAQGERRYLVNPFTCPTYADGLEQQIWAPNGEPDKSQGNDHANGGGYFIHREYRREMGIDIGDYEREDGWWDKGGNLYLENLPAAGFEKVSNLQHGDLVLMQIRSPVPNHAAIFLADGVLKTEPEHYPALGSILHHLYNRDSKRDVYGGYWSEATVSIWRHHGSIAAM